jgi:D-lyxose ketol-isomerase
MKSELIQLSYEIELQPGEKLTLPLSLMESVGAGRWIITIQSVSTAGAPATTRRHDAFLNSYAPEDEGLYDDCPSR